ncbi:MAG: phosphate uptake regulator PhoU [Candidatus Bathyarchaeia archaeon]
MGTEKSIYIVLIENIVFNKLYRKVNNLPTQEVKKELSEETRKIQFTGKSTYIISLPKRWVESMNLEAGSQLIISRQDHSLILTPKDLVKPAKPTEATILISQKDDPNSLMRKIIALYLVGYNFIRIESKDGHITSLQRNFIRDLTRKKLVGTEIISESMNDIRLQILLSYPELSVESALRRMCLIAMSMHEDAMLALKKLDKKLAQDIITLDDEVDRFSFYIIRQLKSAVQSEKILKEIGLTDLRDCLGYRVLVKSVERIADHAAKVAENIIFLEEKINDSITQKISEISHFARSVFSDSINSFYKKNYLSADNLISKAKTITSMEADAIKEISKKVEASKIPYVRMIMESIRRTAEYASDIAEVVLNLNVNQITVT